MELFLNSENIDIALLCEIWLKDNSYTSLIDFNFVGKFREDGYGGVGMYLRREIEFKIVNFRSPLEMIAIETLNLRNNLLLVCIYAKPNLDNFSFIRDLERLLIFCNRSTLPTIICGDFNAKSPTWGKQLSDARGLLLEDCIQDQGFYCLNNGDDTYITENTSSSIDLTLCNSNGLNIDWRVSRNKITNSNHLPIILENNFSLRNFREASKIDYRKLAEDLSTLRVGENIGELYINMEKVVHKNTLKFNAERKDHLNAGGLLNRPNFSV